MDNATYYFTKQTDKELYQYRNILEFVDGEYVITNKITDYNLNEMRNNMDDIDVEEFDKFIEKNWGKVNIKSNRIVEAKEEKIVNKRGRKPNTAK